jgi:hypothetical protein
LPFAAIRENQMATTTAIRNFVLAKFSDALVNPNDDTMNTIGGLIVQFLEKQIAFDELADCVGCLVIVTHPLDILNEMVNISPDPLPPPPETVGYKAGQKRKCRGWTPSEDRRLMAGIWRFGIENWTAISKFVGSGRTRSQCSQRWYRGLDPKICREDWRAEEEEKLMDLIQTYGHKSWTAISSRMGNRTDVQCRYRYGQILSERRRQKAWEMPISWASDPITDGAMEVIYPAYCSALPPAVCVSALPKGKPEFAAG